VTPKLFKIAIEIHLIQLNYTANMCVEERQPLKTAKIGPVICDISETVQDISEDTGRMCVAKLLTHRKSHMAFHLCAKIGDLNDLERRTLWPLFCVISQNLWPSHVTVIEDRSILFATEM